MNPKEIIEQIADERKCEFSSGPSLKNALRVIVERLNSQETHFLLELIQNADDALKDTDEKNPRKLIFTLKQDHLIIQNSGKPFDANDVHDLSSVGDSHKGFDQIGHFGIGFKSVFRVCNYPEVYSGGFSFRYNATDETWIVPEWFDAPTEEYNNVPATFVLSLKEPNRHFELIKSQINQLDPRVLLFLNHLRCIESNGITLVREDLNNGNCLLTHNGKKSLWRIYQAELKVPSLLREELCKLRGEKASRKKKEKIAIAIRLTEDGKSIDLQRKGRIFAFLPTRHDLNFPVDIHADFEVNAERTALVDPERGWNRWLFSKAWTPFLKLFKDCKEGMLNIAEFYGIFPTNEDLKNLSEEIKLALRLMKSKIDSCIDGYKTVPTTDNQWYRPEEVVLADTEFVNLFHDSLPLNEDEKPLHYALTELPDRSKKFLGDHVQFLKEKYVISVLRRLGGQNRSLDWHEHLLIWLASFKDNLKWDKESFFEELKNMPILPTTAGVIVASQNGELRVFRLPKDEKSVPIELFEKQCRFLDVTFAEKVDELKDTEGHSQWPVRELLKKLSPDISPQKLYDDFISPIFKEEKWSSVNEERLLKLTKFVKDHSSSIKKLDIKLKSLSGKFVDPEQLYLTSSFDPDCPFEKLINAKERLISDDYLNLDNEQSMGEKRAQWRDFLIKVRVEQFPKVIKQDPVKINEEDLELRLTRQPKKSFKKGYEIIEQELDPEICSIFEENNLNNLQDSIDRAKILIKLFDKNWNLYEKNLKSHYQFHTKGAQEWSPEELGNSKFAQWLLETQWIPTKSGKLCTISEIVGSNEKVAVAISTAFEEFLFGTALNLNTLCTRLFEMIDQKITDYKRYCELYKQIYKSWRKADEDKQYQITELLKKQPSVFIDKPKTIWLKPTDVVWQSPSWLQSTTLNKIYRGKNCKVLFTDVFDVPERPIPKHLIEFASNNIWNKDLEPKTRSIWQKILSKLEEILDENPSEIENLEWLKRNLKFFCFNHGWVAASESLFYDDNGTLTGNEEFTIEMKIIQPLGEEPLFPMLYEALGIQHISAARSMSDINITKEKIGKGKIHKEIFRPVRSASCSPEMASLNCCDWKPEDELSSKKDSQALGKKQGISGSNISDAERRSIGDWGEELVFHWEKKRLKEQGQQDLAEKVEWKSKGPNRYHPFDILSFDLDENGNWNPIEIEVKSTPYPYGDTGILSNEQWEYAKDHADKHRLYIVYLAKSDKPVVRRLKFGEWIITPHTYNLKIAVGHGRTQINTDF